jgi:hypothetical protein
MEAMLDAGHDGLRGALALPRRLRGFLMRLESRHIAVLSAVLLGSFWGCGSSAVQEAALVPVKGTVAYKGKPLTQGTIEFEPQTGGRLARGAIQSDGTFTLTTTKDGDGVAAGTHLVYVRATGGDAKKEVVPLKYTQAASSGYQVEVSAEKNELAINFK